MIRCGWCDHPTKPDEDCRSCGHEDPARPWVQRGKEPPVVRVDAVGRPTLDTPTIRRKLREARAALGPDATREALAEQLGVSVRTVGRWQLLADR